MFGAIFALITSDRSTSNGIGGFISEAVKLFMVIEKDAELLHQMKYEAFLPFLKDEKAPLI